MSQQIRLEYPGSLWRVTAHGNRSEPIYRDDTDRRLFLHLLGVCVSRADWVLTAYILTLNEFQLLIRLTAKTLSSGMQWLSSTYAQRFNRRHQLVGHLFHGRFNGCLIDEQTYFMDVMRYVVLAPVRAGIVSKPEEYRWSSHPAVLGTAPKPKWLAIDDVLRRFSNARETARERYRVFVDAGLESDRNPFDEVVGDIYLGSRTWLGEVRKQLAIKLRSDDRSRLQRTLCTAKMADVITAVADAWSTHASGIRNGRGGVPRMVAAWIAANETLLTNRDIASGLRLRSSARVAQMIRDCDRALDASARLRAFVDRSVSTLRRKM